MSVFSSNTDSTDYPAYLVKFTVDATGYPYSFFIIDGSGNYSPALSTDASSSTALVAVIASYINTNGWQSSTVSDLTVTKYAEASSDVTP
jgi:hypothetical protein